MHTRNDSYYFDLIMNTKEIFNGNKPNFHNHAGYNKFSSQKEYLHNSLLSLKEHLKISEIFYVSTLFKFETYDDFMYLVYFPENDLLIKIYCEATYDSININWCSINRDMNAYYFKKFEENIFPKIQKKEVIYFNIEFINSYKNRGVKNV